MNAFVVGAHVPMCMRTRLAIMYICIMQNYIRDYATVLCVQQTLVREKQEIGITKGLHYAVLVPNRGIK